MTLRRCVLFMLIVTLLAPIVLYTGRLESFNKSWSSKNDLVADGSFSGGLDDPNERLNHFTGLLDILRKQGSFKTTEVNNGAVIYYNSTVRDADPSVSLTKIVALEQEAEEFKSRLLYVISNGTKSGKQNNEQAVGGLREDHQSDILSRYQPVNEGKKVVENVHTYDGGMPRWIRRTSKTSELNRDQASVENRINTGEPFKQITTKRNDRRVLPDSRIRHMKDLLIRAKVYSSMANAKNNPHFTREIRQRVKEVQKALGAATKDSDLPRNSYEKVKAMERALSTGTHVNNDCTGLVKKLRAMLHSTEDQLRAQKKQTLFLTQISSKTVSKGLHCLPLALSTAYYSMSSSQQQLPDQHRLADLKLYHYAVLSDNILAAAVVVNSTVFHSKEPSRHVFHVMTDRLNYAAMKKWFLSNPPGKASIEVRNVDEFDWLNSTGIPALMHTAARTPPSDHPSKSRSAESGVRFKNPKYLSLLNHLRFYLPYMLPNLDKVLFLDDDVVVQRDLTELWRLDLEGKVNGAAEIHGEDSGRLDRYLNFSNPSISEILDPRARAWAFGMNLFDLEEWRRRRITEVYHNWRTLSEEGQLWKLGTLPPGLLTFWNHTYILPRDWHLTGLGYDPDISDSRIEQAAVIHYSGNLKPWLEVSIPRYRNYWARFLDHNHAYLRECNIHPS